MLLDRGYNPRRSFYIAFGHDEEVRKTFVFHHFSITLVLSYCLQTCLHICNHIFSSLILCFDPIKKSTVSFKLQ